VFILTSGACEVETQPGFPETATSANTKVGRSLDSPLTWATLKSAMIGKLLMPVIVAPREMPSLLETLHAGAAVEFDLVEGLTEVLCDGKLFSAMLRDLLDATHPVEWFEPAAV
jgi:hypothetical protein